MPRTSLKGSGAAEKTIARTSSASFTIPSTRLISASLPANALPSARLSTRAENAERLSSSASNGAIETVQLTSAHKVKKPSARNIVHIAKPIRSGSPVTAMCVSATHCIDRNQPQTTNANRHSHTACNRTSAAGRNGERRPELDPIRRNNIARPTPETTTHPSAAIGSSQRKTATTCGS